MQPNESPPFDPRDVPDPHELGVLWYLGAYRGLIAWVPYKGWLQQPECGLEETPERIALWTAMRLEHAG